MLEEMGGDCANSMSQFLNESMENIRTIMETNPIDVVTHDSDTIAELFKIAMYSLLSPIKVIADCVDPIMLFDIGAVSLSVEVEAR